MERPFEFRSLGGIVLYLYLEHGQKRAYGSLAGLVTGSRLLATDWSITAGAFVGTEPKIS